jgi:hypothetical protein
METLDGDVNPLFSKQYGKYCARDIVQFVPFNQVYKDPSLLARKVLEEVPKQVTDYFQSRNILPNPKNVQDKTELTVKSKMRNQMKTMMNVQDSYFIQ